MCGRYTLSTPIDDLVEVFDVPPVDFEHAPRYNIAPTQSAPVVASDRYGTRMGLMRWGLVPSWADDPGIGSRTINARAETLRRKPALREAVAARRCLVPADGFYEWVKEGSRKVPHWIHAPDGVPFAFAGLWERWDGGGIAATPLYSFTIVTVEPNEAVRPLHDRMPAIVATEDRGTWLDKGTDIDRATAVLRPYEGPLESYAVSTLVNSPANEIPECIEPV